MLPGKLADFYAVGVPFRRTSFRFPLRLSVFIDKRQKGTVLDRAPLNDGQ